MWGVISSYGRANYTDDYIRAEETTAQVLNEPERKAETKSYI